MHTYFLESEHTGPNGWPTIVMPSVPDPDLAPPGHHVLHATMTESYDLWENLERTSPEYAALKEERSEILMGLVRQVCALWQSAMRLLLRSWSNSKLTHRLMGLLYDPQ